MLIWVSLFNLANKGGVGQSGPIRVRPEKDKLPYKETVTKTNTYALKLHQTDNDYLRRFLSPLSLKCPIFD